MKEENTQEVTLTETLGPLNEFHKRLTGENGREWFNEFKKFLRKEEAWTIPNRWKKNLWTVATMGLKKPLKVLVTEIIERDFNIQYSDSHPLDLIALEECLEFNKVGEDVYFAAVSPRELGLRPGKWTKRQLLDTASKNGLTPCLSGDILEILSQGKFELKKEDSNFCVGMEPILIGNNPSMFCVAKYDKNHLGYLNGDLYQVYTYPDNVDNKHIFRIKKKYSF